MQHIQRSILILICLTLLFASFVKAQEKQSKELFKVKVDGKYGFIDKSGKIVIEPKFQGVYDFSDGLAKIHTSGEFNTAYIDKTGKIVIEQNFDAAKDFFEGLAAVGFGVFLSHGVGEHKWGFINKTGNLLIKEQFIETSNFAKVTLLCRMANANGDTLTKPENLLFHINLMMLLIFQTV